MFKKMYIYSYKSMEKVKIDKGFKLKILNNCLTKAKKT